MDSFVPLVIRAKAGDNKAFGELIEMYEDLVFTIVRRRIRDNFAVNDVTQDVFLRAFRKIGQLDDPVKFKSWICQIAARLSINYALRAKQFEGRENFNPAGEEKDPVIGLILKKRPSRFVTPSKRSNESTEIQWWTSISMIFHSRK